MTWTDLKKHIYYTDGSLRGIYIMDTTREEWRKWAEFINNNYQVIFIDENGQKQNQIDISALFRIWNNNDHYNNHPKASISVGDMIINCHFFTAEQIENDIDPREFDSIDNHHQLMNYMSGLSKLLDKKVILTYENTAEGVYIAVEKDQIWINPS